MILKNDFYAGCMHLTVSGALLCVVNIPLFMNRNVQIKYPTERKLSNTNKLGDVQNC